MLMRIHGGWEEVHVKQGKVVGLDLVQGKISQDVVGIVAMLALKV